MGSTSHYVTTDLDEGPIIAQAITPISHRDTISDMKRKGRDIEKIRSYKGDMLTYPSQNHRKR